jgi:hypothetical protein
MAGAEREREGEKGRRVGGRVEAEGGHYLAGTGCVLLRDDAGGGGGGGGDGDDGMMMDGGGGGRRGRRVMDSRYSEHVPCILLLRLPW